MPNLRYNKSLPAGFAEEEGTGRIVKGEATPPPSEPPVAAGAAAPTPIRSVPDSDPIAAAYGRLAAQPTEDDRQTLRSQAIRDIQSQLDAQRAFYVAQQQAERSRLAKAAELGAKRVSALGLQRGLAGSSVAEAERGTQAEASAEQERLAMSQLAAQQAAAEQSLIGGATTSADAQYAARLQAAQDAELKRLEYLASLKPAEGAKPVVVGDALVDPTTGKAIYTAPGTEAEEKTYTLSPGQAVFNRNNEIIAYNPPTATESKTYTLSPGEAAFNSKNEMVAFNPKAAGEEGAPKTIDTSVGTLMWNAESKSWVPVSVDGQAVGPDADKTSFNDILSGRKSILADKRIGDYVELSSRYDNMKSALDYALAKGDTGSKAAADQALITLYNKMLDPTSVVREGEYARTAEGQSVIGRASGYLEMLKQGGAGITDEIRRDMVNVSEKLLASAKTTYDSAATEYVAAAQAAGVDPSIYLPQITSAVSGVGASGSAGGGEYVREYRQGGKSYIQRGNTVYVDVGGGDFQPVGNAEVPKADGATGKTSAAPNARKLAQAIGQYESGGNYDARGPVVTSGMYKGQRAIGRYQIMPGNVASWTKEALGYSMTPEQFAKSPEAQDAVAEQRMGKLLAQGYSPSDVASIWFTGRPLAKAGDAKDVLGTTAPKYVQNVLAILNRMG